MMPFWISDEERRIRLQSEINQVSYEFNKFQEAWEIYAREYGVIKYFKKRATLFKKMNRLVAKFRAIDLKITKTNRYEPVRSNTEKETKDAD